MIYVTIPNMGYCYARCFLCTVLADQYGGNAILGSQGFSPLIFSDHPLLALLFV